MGGRVERDVLVGGWRGMRQWEGGEGCVGGRVERDASVGGWRGMCGWEGGERCANGGWTGVKVERGADGRVEVMHRVGG